MHVSESMTLFTLSGYFATAYSPTHKYSDSGTRISASEGGTLAMDCPRTGLRLSNLMMNGGEDGSKDTRATFCRHGSFRTQNSRHRGGLLIGPSWPSRGPQRNCQSHLHFHNRPRSRGDNMLLGLRVHWMTATRRMLELVSRRGLFELWRVGAGWTFGPETTWA